MSDEIPTKQNPASKIVKCISCTNGDFLEGKLYEVTPDGLCWNEGKTKLVPWGYMALSGEFLELE